MAQRGIALLRILVLARILVPDDFGLIAIATLTVESMLLLTDFGLLPALVQKQERRNRDYEVAWTLGLVRAVAIAGIVIAAAPAIAALFDEPRAVALLRVLALRPVLQACASMRLADLTRELRFRPLGLIVIAGVIVETFVAIALAPSLGVWALVAGALAGAGVAMAMSFVMAPWRPRLAFDRATARPLLRFGRWIFVTGVLAVVGNAFLQSVISRRLGTAELGLYFMAAKLAMLPGEVAAEVVGGVAFPVYARLQSDRVKATRTFRAILVGLGALLIPAYVWLIALAPSLVQDVLGPKWEGAAPVLRVLGLAGLLGFFGDTVVPVLKGLGQPYKIAALEAAQSFLIIVLVWGLAGRFGLAGAAMAWLPAVAVSQILSLLFVRGLMDRPLSGLGRPLAAIVAATAMGTVVAVALDAAIPGLVGLIVAACAAAGVTYGLLALLDRLLGLGLVRDLVRAFPQLAAIRAGIART